MPASPAASPAEVHADDPALVASQYRRARVYLVSALLLLAGTAIYIVIQERERIAVGLERGATGLLAQSTFSLRGISVDIADEPGSGAATLVPVLREAMRFDSLSEYLGVRASKAGEIAVVDRAVIRLADRRPQRGPGLR